MKRPDLLRGIRIIDLSMGWAGPLATRHLADMGAEIIKVESCVHFDWFRGWEASQRWIDANEAEKHPPFNALNRNKLDVTLDLSRERGRDLLFRLVSVSDAVIENFAASVLPKLGLGYQEFKRVQSAIVMVSMPGFGTRGPWRDYRAYGSTAEQAAGLPHLSGYPESPPTHVHIALGDAVAGLNGAAAMLTALRHLRRTGEGQFVDLSHAECLFPFGVHGIAEQALTGSAPPRLGNRSRRFAPHGSYPCLGGTWVVVQVQDEAQWAGMQVAVGESISGFGGISDRLERADELDAAIAAWTSERPADEAMVVLQQAGVAAGAVRQSDELTEEPHLKDRGYWKYMERDYVGELPHAAAPFRIDGRPLGIDWPSPTLGQHNREVLGGLLGLTDQQIAELERDQIVGTKPRLPGVNAR